VFKNWAKLFTPDCRIIILDVNNSVYPIFKNGQTSLFLYADEKKLKILKNQQLQDIKKIKVFLRDPLQRFVSGVHTVIELEKINNIDVFLKEVECFKTYNRHFIPQFYWLMHLFKYFKGVVELVPIDGLYKLIPTRGGPPIKKLTGGRKKKILSINNKMYVDVDYKLLNKYIGQTVGLEKIIKEFKNAVS
jgi:hypothetical protein